MRVVALDEFTLIFHHASGLTHLVTTPAPEILAALDGRSMTRDALLVALGESFELGDASAGALDARLGELVSAGLVVAA
ncbi:HPr-rel-A system PqqD family peptide chaperone [Sphingomonas koreensis]|nr:HPr-rel-A system PqqD family peptide chaperone [Sphingomonas koreensis]